MVRREHSTQRTIGKVVARKKGYRRKNEAKNGRDEEDGGQARICFGMCGVREGG
jgi:hypothetical protein